MLEKLLTLIPGASEEEGGMRDVRKEIESIQKETSGLDPAKKKEIEKIKSNILANFTRELLTSMRSIMELMECLLSLKDDKEKKEMEIIVKNTRRLLELSSPLVQLFQNHIFKEEEQEKRRILKTDEEFMKELNQVIEKNHSDPDFNVEKLTKKLCISKSSLYRKIYELTGESPSEFIRSFRLQRAVQLIKRNFGSVTKVAFEVGFNSRTYFAKCFKEKFHQSPSSFRASEKKNN